jgi:lipopolysaccharide/colanic/teichoic acid biosynthesis glycosyltransferase
MTTTDTIDPIGSPLASPARRAKKRALSRAAAVLLLILSLPLWLLVAALVWSNLGSPVFFTQTRSGLGGRVFVIRKFRTMRDTVGADGSPLPDPERLTPFGRFLRRTRLDELPQLLSIADGSMAFVGPRPLLPETVAHFGALGRVRSLVRPGLTGWAQVNGNTLLSNAEKLALDLWYIEHGTPRLDAKILLTTALLPFRGERIDARNIARAEADLLLRHRLIGWGSLRR